MTVCERLCDQLLVGPCSMPHTWLPLFGGSSLPCSKALSTSLGSCSPSKAALSVHTYCFFRQSCSLHRPISGAWGQKSIFGDGQYWIGAIKGIQDFRSSVNHWFIAFGGSPGSQIKTFHFFAFLEGSKGPGHDFFPISNTKFKFKRQTLHKVAQHKVDLNR